jgi:hypothetical protein
MWRRKSPNLKGVALALALALVASIEGCGSGEATALTTLDEAPVKGTVSYRGKLLDGGTLHFNASNAKRIIGPRDAPIAKDGSFNVKALLGQNVVTVSPKTRTKANFGLENEEQTVDVKPGENVIRIEYMP